MSIGIELLEVCLGTRADYLALKDHHYRVGDPATWSRVLVVRDSRPTAADRFLSRVVVPRPVAVLVESLPTLSCRARDAALGGRYGDLRAGARAKLLHEEVRCISRVIVDPRYRSMGLAVRLVRHALATATTRYTEALAVMGRISPFFERAGMTAYERPPLPASQRAIAALHHVGIEPVQLTSPSMIQQQIEALPTEQRQLLIHELTRWYRAAGGRGTKRPIALPDLIDAARQKLLADPIYYLHERRAK